MRVSSHNSPGGPFGNGRRLVKSGGQGCVFFGSLPIHVYDLVDRAGERAAIAMPARTRLARTPVVVPDRARGRYMGATLYYPALLVEAAKYLRRWELGAVIGAERAPVVKALRRKLAELVTQAQAFEFGRLLARRWVGQALIASAYLYVPRRLLRCR